MLTTTKKCDKHLYAKSENGQHWSSKFTHSWNNYGVQGCSLPGQTHKFEPKS